MFFSAERWIIAPAKRFVSSGLLRRSKSRWKEVFFPGGKAFTMASPGIVATKAGSAAAECFGLLRLIPGTTTLLQSERSLKC